MDTRTEISKALKEALKSQDKIAVSTIRLIIAALKDRDITIREQGQADSTDEAGVLSLLQSMIKQRQESSKTYSEAGRDDLAEREESEIEVIRTFMPRQLSEDEVEDVVIKLIEKTGAESIKDMGKIMGALKSEYAGQVDMGKAGEIAKQKLA